MATYRKRECVIIYENWYIGSLMNLFSIFELTISYIYYLLTHITQRSEMWGCREPAGKLGTHRPQTPIIINHFYELR